MVFAIICFLVDEKIKLKVLACSLKSLKGTNAVILTLKMHTGSRLCSLHGSVKHTGRRPRQDNSCSFSLAANKRIALEKIDQLQRREF